MHHVVDYCTCECSWIIQGSWRWQWWADLPPWCRNKRSCGCCLWAVHIRVNSGLVSSVSSFVSTGRHDSCVDSKLRVDQFGTRPLCIACHCWRSQNFIDIAWALVPTLPWICEICVYTSLQFLHVLIVLFLYRCYKSGIYSFADSHSYVTQINVHPQKVHYINSLQENCFVWRESELNIFISRQELHIRDYTLCSRLCGGCR